VGCQPTGLDTLEAEAGADQAHGGESTGIVPDDVTAMQGNRLRAVLPDGDGGDGSHNSLEESAGGEPCPGGGANAVTETGGEGTKGKGEERAQGKAIGEVEAEIGTAVFEETAEGNTKL
jgi:hypothetical protein